MDYYNLPPEIRTHILNFLPLSSLRSYRCVNKTEKILVDSMMNSYWKNYKQIRIHSCLKEKYKNPFIHKIFPKEEFYTCRFIYQISKQSILTLKVKSYLGQFEGPFEVSIVDEKNNITIDVIGEFKCDFLTGRYIISVDEPLWYYYNFNFVRGRVDGSWFYYNNSESTNLVLIRGNKNFKRETIYFHRTDNMQMFYKEIKKLVDNNVELSPMFNYFLKREIYRSELTYDHELTIDYSLNSPYEEKKNFSTLISIPMITTNEMRFARIGYYNQNIHYIVIMNEYFEEINTIFNDRKKFVRDTDVFIEILNNIIDITLNRDLSVSISYYGIIYYHWFENTENLKEVEIINLSNNSSYCYKFNEEGKMIFPIDMINYVLSSTN